MLRIELWWAPRKRNRYVMSRAGYWYGSVLFVSD